MGLDYAHSLGLVHRDLNPANIFLIGEAPSFEVKLIDFGLAKLLADSTDKLTQTGLVIGTPQYMSPELARGQKIDHQSDIYSFGCVMYEVLSDKPAFNADSPVALLYLQQHKYPDEPHFLLSDKSREQHLKQIILRCLQKDPALRFQSCEELTSALSSENPLMSPSGSGQKRQSLHPSSRSSKAAAKAS